MLALSDDKPIESDRAASPPRDDRLFPILPVSGSAIEMAMMVLRNDFAGDIGQGLTRRNAHRLHSIRA
jgi:hypothetical protein